MRLRYDIALLVCSMCSCFLVSGQSREDSMNWFRHSMHDIFDQAVNAIKKDSSDKPSIQVKSEDVYALYKGRYIRHVIVSGYGFEKRLSDTTKFIRTAGTRIYNKLHIDTKEWVVRDNLFIREGKEVNPYLLADNERWLRNLDFIQDARMILRPVEGADDSVDVEVITKDLFSVTGDLDASSFRQADGGIADANFLGMGQRVQFSAVYDDRRAPRIGYEMLYKKNNAFGSFVDATIAYSQINTGRSEGEEDEEAYYFRLHRPLISAFSHFAGGLEISRNRSVNFFSKPDSVFYNYGYNTFDTWVGYNLCAYRKTGSEGERNRKFVSLRYFSNWFSRLPEQVGDSFDPIYNSKEAVLGQITFFRQEFYKTNYVYGFGTTEDLPYGYNFSVITGWYKQNRLERPYLGFDLNRYVASGRGAFYQGFLKAGGFYKNGKIQDAGILVGGSMFSRLAEPGSLKFRQYFRLTYAQVFNRLTYEQLYINSRLGLFDFNTWDVYGDQRISSYAESFLFTDFKLFGFRFAPYVFADAVLIKPEHLPVAKADVFTGAGGGVRVRNENLVFGTVQIKCTYFPRTVDGVQGFKVDMSSGLQFRYRSTLVAAPDILRMNNDELLYWLQ